VKAGSRRRKKDPWKGPKPRGASGRIGPRPASGKGLGPGSKPRSRRRRPFLQDFVLQERQPLANGTWVHRGGNAPVPGSRGKLRRANPRSAAGPSGPAGIRREDDVKRVAKP
jgi:hypothetical protein